MGLKDKINSFISYFDTDEVSDTEEVETSEYQETARPVAPVQPVPYRQESQRVTAKEQIHLKAVTESGPSLAQQREHMAQNAPISEKSKIAIKYPRQYEDAPEIVNLLIENESVLIDFQYMLDAPARRCLDFLSGASSVLFGNLQKVSSSMYLLTPANVVVDIEDLGLSERGQHNEASSFDYDMKRR
ncbi:MULTISPECIES: cell division protein SepF [Streptococcus]|uniref:Cell division protein SepF n=1 Tax=Streptococcus caledonicus TaxID=2614158 RepID=A0ABW0UC67_9STRE|nr:cell division protein SepF [Streptococcus sp. S784/96/1]